MLLHSNPEAFGGDIYTSVAAEGYANMQTSVNAGYGSSIHPIGTRGFTRDGRVFRWGRAGGSNLVAGTLQQASAPISNHINCGVTATAIGAVAVTVTLGATAATANQYAGGYLLISTGPGNGYMYVIDSHPAIGSAGTGVITLVKDDAIQVALTTSSKVDLIANPYADVIQAPTTLTAVAVGVPLFPITAAQYGWLQTWGPCPLLINGTPAVTAPVVNSATVAGAGDVWTAAAQPTAQMIGHMMQVGVDTKNKAVFLTLAP